MGAISAWNKVSSAFDTLAAAKTNQNSTRKETYRFSPARSSIAQNKTHVVRAVSFDAANGVARRKDR